LVYFNANGQLPQRFDSLYKKIYLEDAVKLIRNNRNILLLDVRSPDEYADRSAFLPLNIGRLKGSKNISIDSMKGHLKELEPYKNKEILVYCSHSQRSRLVSKLLTENGFKNVYNVKGGMSLLNELSQNELPGKSAVYTSNLSYKLIQSEDAFKFIQDRNNLIVDVRPESQFNNTDTAFCNDIGRIKNAVNIPADKLDKKIPDVVKNKDRPILLYDMDGTESAKAAVKLTNKGYKKIYVLFEGLPALLSNTGSSSKLRSEIFTGLPQFNIIGTKEVIELVNKDKNLVIADLRPNQEFINKSNEHYYNLGRIKNAINIPSHNLDSLLKNKPKTIPVLIYGSFASNTKIAGMPRDFDYTKNCKHLASEGYSNIYLVYDGLYSIVWNVTNTKIYSQGLSILTDHKGLY